MPAPSASPFPLRALLFLPGTLFWVLVIVGAVTENSTYIGYALGLGAVTLGVFAVLKVKQSRDKGVHRALTMAAGSRAQARIVSTRVRGSLNNDPYVVFVLEVLPLMQAPYRVEITELVSQLAIPRIQPDTLIDVHIHPDDPKYVVIDPAALGRN